MAPDAVAVDFPQHARLLTWADWDAQSLNLARSFVDLGLQKGERIALLAENRVEWVVVQMAAARAGLILVPINTHSRSDDLHFALEQSESRALVLSPSFRSNPFRLMVESIRDRLPHLEHIVLIDDDSESEWPSFDSLITAGADSSAELPVVSPDDPEVIMYTSGTTGRPKGVVLSHSAVMANGRAVFERMEVIGSDVVTSVVPMFHAASFCATMPGCLATGAAYVGVEAFHPLEMMEVIQSRRVTVHVAVPTTMRAMLQHPRRKEFDLSSLRVATCGGADNDPDMLNECIREFPIPYVVQGYGITEGAGLVTVAHVDQKPDKTSAGFPLTSYELRIVSVETGEVLPPNSAGEIQIRSANVFSEYFRLPDQTAATFTDDGWLKTGDLGELSPESELRMTGGRLKDMIIRGGENISPAEVENTLARHPMVKEVAVFGVPDAQLGEVVAAALIPQGRVTAEELKKFCSERIARFKVPAIYYVVERFPLTPSEKIRKADLRAQAVAGALTLLGDAS